MKKIVLNIRPEDVRLLLFHIYHNLPYPCFRRGITTKYLGIYASRFMPKLQSSVRTYNIP